MRNYHKIKQLASLLIVIVSTSGLLNLAHSKEKNYITKELSEKNSIEEPKSIKRLQSNIRLMYAKAGRYEGLNNGVLIASKFIPESMVYDPNGEIIKTKNQKVVKVMKNPENNNQFDMAYQTDSGTACYFFIKTFPKFNELSIDGNAYDNNELSLKSMCKDTGKQTTIILTSL